jgi:hypothetical protein
MFFSVGSDTAQKIGLFLSLDAAVASDTEKHCSCKQTFRGSRRLKGTRGSWPKSPKQSWQCVYTSATFQTTNVTYGLYVDCDVQRVYHMVIKDMWIFPFKGLPNFTKTGGFGSKINHLATLGKAKFSTDCNEHEDFGAIFVGFEPAELFSGDTPRFCKMVFQILRCFVPESNTDNSKWQLV